ncbi:unnamed protein product, partial [Amoebophrya sp. A120]
VPESLSDPDPAFVLTRDVLQKILAIHMRFSAGLPVFISGETGIGKTALLEYYAKVRQQLQLHAPNQERRTHMDGQGSPLKLMRTVKVHGGVGRAALNSYVKEALQLARFNARKGVRETLLFFDEANTSLEVVWGVKELMTNGRLHGRDLRSELEGTERNFETGEQFPFRLLLAMACNPYRVQPLAVRRQMHRAGLGYRHAAEEVESNDSPQDDPAARVRPMRDLVYRVVRTPPSLRDSIFEFGSLPEDAEADYARQIILRRIQSMLLDGRLRPAPKPSLSRAQRDTVSEGSGGDSETAQVVLDQEQVWRDMVLEIQKLRKDSEKGENKIRDIERDVFLSVEDSAAPPSGTVAAVA